MGVGMTVVCLPTGTLLREAWNESLRRVHHGHELRKEATGSNLYTKCIWSGVGGIYQSLDRGYDPAEYVCNGSIDQGLGPGVRLFTRSQPSAIPYEVLS